MVVFTCNHCGESLKKQAVEKHYTWKKCQNAPVFVTCVDCLKDFRGQEYVAHTKCITEAERYHGKDFQGKASQNKGQKKQEAWTDIIQSVLRRDDLSTRIRGVLDTLTRHENVPRKKAKFLNFMKNVSRQTSEYDCNRIFDLIEEAFTEAKGKVTNGTAGQENGKEDHQEEEKPRKRKKGAVENGENGDMKDPEADEPKKKKKKAKKLEEAVAETVEVQEEEEMPKKKRKKQQNGDKEELPGDEPTTEPKKKKKKKQLPESTAEKSKSRKEVVQEIKNSSNDTDGFPWKESIIQILSKNDNKMSLEKLKKRLFKKYQKMHPENTQMVNAIDLFVQRKIRKVKRVSVEGDFVTLAA